MSNRRSSSTANVHYHRSDWALAQPSTEYQTFITHQYLHDHSPERSSSWPATYDTASTINNSHGYAEDYLGDGHDCATHIDPPELLEGRSALQNHVSAAPPSLSGSMENHDDEDLHHLTGYHASEKPADSITQYPKNARFWAVIIGISLAELMRGLDDTLVNAISPVLAQDFSAIHDVSWFSSAYYFPQAALTVLYGRLTPEFQLRYAWAAGFVLFFVGSGICALAHIAAAFIIGRAVCGLGSALLLPVGLSIITYLTDDDERPKYIALVVSFHTISAGAGPLIGAVFAERASWRWAFVMNLPIIFILASVVFVAFNHQRNVHRESRHWRLFLKRFDFTGCLLFIAATVLVLLGFQFAAQSSSWTGAGVVTLLVFGGLTTLGFLIQQYCGTREFSFVPTSITNKETFLAAFLGFFSLGASRTVEYYLPFYFQEVKGTTVILFATQTLPALISGGLGSVTIGLVISYLTYDNIAVLIAGILLSIGACLCSQFSSTTSTGLAIGLSIISSFAAGIMTVLTLSTAQRHVHRSHAAEAMSLVLTMQLLGTSLCVTLAGTTLNQKLSSGIAALSPGGGGGIGIPSDVQQALEANAAGWGALRRKGGLSADVVREVSEVFASATKEAFIVALGSALLGLVVGTHLGWFRKGKGVVS